MLSPGVGNADYLGLAQKREDAAGHIGTVNSGSVWTRLHGQQAKLAQTKNDNQDLIDMGFIEDEEEKEEPQPIVALH